MKRIIAFLLTLVMIFTLFITSAASTVSVATEMTNVRGFYTSKIELELFEETMVLAAMGMLAGRTAFIPEKDGTAAGLARRILANTAAQSIPEQDEDVTELKALQNEEGSFGSIEEHCLAMLALTSRKEIYNSAKAYRWLMDRQAENGSFSDSAKTTALAIAVLAQSENMAEISAKSTASRYLIGLTPQNGEELAWKIMGITDSGVDANTVGDRNLLEELLSYQNTTDYSFYRSKNDGQTDPVTTALALAALDAINEDSGMFLRIAREGKLSLYEPSDLKPLIIFGVVMLAVSCGFWTYILLHKKSTKTLNDTKTY